MCIYGVELLADNITECRENLIEVFADFLNLDTSRRSISCRILRAVLQSHSRRRADYENA